MQNNIIEENAYTAKTITQIKDFDATKPLSKDVITLLIQKAQKMLDVAYVPYSNYTVGASLLAKDGTIFTGCNIENVAFGPSNCAERTALFKAVSEGVKDFVAIAVIGGPEKKVTDFCTPCGVCRQALREFLNADCKVILAKSVDEYKILTLEELLPLSFKPKGEVGKDAE